MASVQIAKGLLQVLKIFLHPLQIGLSSLFVLKHLELVGSLPIVLQECLFGRQSVNSVHQHLQIACSGKVETECHLRIQFLSGHVSHLLALKS